MSRKRFDAVAVGLLLLITTALSAAPCEPALNFARSALRAASLSHGLEQKVASKLNNATRMSHSSNSSGIKNAIQQLDVALSLLSGPEVDGVPPEIIAPIRTAITDYRACLASAPPVQTATVTVTVTAADHTAAAGANVRVDNEIVGQTGNDGRFTFAAPAGTQIAITADLDYISGGGLTVTLVAGSTNSFAITLAEESEFAEHNEVAIDEMRDGVLPAAFPSLTLRILDGDKSVTMVSADAVVLETKRGIATDVTSLFSVNKKGEIVAPKPDAVRDVINGYFGPLTFRVMGWDSNNFFYDSRVSFLVGRYGLKGKILPPAGDPTISTANISLGLTGVDGATFWVRTDANGNYAFSSLPKDSYLVRADKLTSSVTYAVRAPLFLDADTVQDFTLKSPNELFPAPSAAQAASNGRVGVKSAEDGTYTLDFPTVGTSPQTQPNTKELFLEIPQGTLSVTFNYYVETTETKERATTSPVAGGDYFGFGLQYGPPFYGVTIVNPMDQVNLMYARGDFPNGIPGRSKDYVLPVDVSKLTATGPLKVRFAGNFINCCLKNDSSNDSILHVTLVVPQSCPVPPSNTVTVEAACPPTIELLGITPDGTPPNGSDANNDDNYYSIPRPGQGNYYTRLFYIGLRTTPADATLKADIDIVNQETGAAMQRIHSGMNLTPFYPLRYILPISYDLGLTSSINGTPPPAYQIRYHFHITAEKNGVTTEKDYYSDTTGNAPEYSLWRMTPIFNGLRFGGGHFTSPFEGICLNQICFGGDNWSSRGAYGWMEANTSLLTRINHISGENGRYIGHSGHARGSDIDIYHFWPTVSGATADPIGGDVYNTLKRDAMTAHDINDPNKQAAAQAAINEITTWLNASRAGIDALLKKGDVAQVGYLIDGGEFSGRHRPSGKGGTPVKAPLNIVEGWGKILLQTGVINYNDGTTVDTHTGLWSNRTNAKMFYWPGHHTHVHITLDRCAIDHLGCASGPVLFCSRPFVEGTSGNATIDAGQSTTIGVSVSGSSPYFVQWTAVGLDESEVVLPVSGTSVTVAPTATTIYTAKVANYCGDDIGAPIVITVRPPCVAPSITIQPSSQSTTQGVAVSLSVAASGSDELHYQWYVESTPIFGATSSTLSVTPLSTAHYSVTITNSCGSVTSNTVTVAVCVPATIVAQPQPVTIDAGNTAALSVAAIGSAPFGYQWFVGVPPNATQPVPGGANATLNVAPSSTTDYWVRVHNSCGQRDSNSVRVTVTACEAPAITKQPQSIGIVSGSTATLSVTLTGTMPFSYQWYTNGTPIAGANASTLNVTPSATTNYNVIVTNSCGTATSATATVTVTSQCVPPAITHHPQSSTIINGQSVTLSVVATGTATLEYQWLANGAPISGAVSDAVIVAPATTTSYSVIVSNGCGSVTSNAATVTVVCGDAPAITQQPQSSSIVAGQTTTLTVAASGTAPLSYQWYSAGNPLAGANSSSLVVGPATTTDYSVTVTNSCGSVTSNTATISVSCAGPVITQQPQSQTINRGAMATLTVAASGSNPAYQWYVSDPAGSTFVPAGTGNSITVAPNGSTATYYVVVTACGNTAQSSVATITTVECITAPSIIQQPQDTTYAPGSSATFSVVANGAGLTYQWYGADPAGSAYTLIAGAVSPALTVTPSSSVAGYFCRIGNECGKTVDSAVATATVQCEPKFFQQPQSQKSTNPGQQQIFMAVSVGSDTPVAYQWYSSTDFNFTPIAGATESFITVTPSQTTYYYCAAKNACGESQSFIATITVCYAPVITQQPQSQTVTRGNSVTLSVAANSPTGDELRYQWYLGIFDPQAISGATGPSVTFSPQFSEEYSVRVTNGCTDTWSDIASVTVTDPAP